MSRATLIDRFVEAWEQRYRDGEPVNVPAEDLTPAEIADWYADAEFGLRDFRYDLGRAIVAYGQTNDAKDILSELIADWCCAEGNPAEAIAMALAPRVARDIEDCVIDALVDKIAAEEVIEPDPYWHGVSEFGPDMTQVRK